MFYNMASGSHIHQILLVDVSIASSHDVTFFLLVLLAYMLSSVIECSVYLSL